MYFLFVILVHLYLFLSRHFIDIFKIVLVFQQTNFSLLFFCLFIHVYYFIIIIYFLCYIFISVFIYLHFIILVL